jgi:metal-responsive CopG/Arc/MetJ family transcriptional regulator
MAYMKTAISIDEELFRKAENLSSKLQISRSQLFTQALEYLIDRSETLEVIQKLNQVYGQTDSEAEARAMAKSGKKTMKGVIGEW